MRWSNLHVPHPHIRIADYHRRIVAGMFVFLVIVHYYMPEHELWVATFTNLVWLFGPTPRTTQA